MFEGHLEVEISSGLLLTRFLRCHTTKLYCCEKVVLTCFFRKLVKKLNIRHLNINNRLGLSNS